MQGTGTSWVEADWSCRAWFCRKMQEKEAKKKEEQINNNHMYA